MVTEFLSKGCVSELLTSGVEAISPNVLFDMYTLERDQHLFC